jgi:hypothetical protein
MHITPVVFALAAVGCIVALAACGSAGYNAAATTNASAGALTLSECMHAHGIKNFPDPTSVPGGAAKLAPAGINPSSPAFQHAVTACGGGSRTIG